MANEDNRKYQTSPALCNPTTPFVADSLRPDIFRILFALAWLLSLLLQDVIGD